MLKWLKYFSFISCTCAHPDSDFFFSVPWTIYESFLPIGSNRHTSDHLTNCVRLISFSYGQCYNFLGRFGNLGHRNTARALITCFLIINSLIFSVFLYVSHILRHFWKYINDYNIFYNISYLLSEKNTGWISNNLLKIRIQRVFGATEIAPEPINIVFILKGNFIIKT